MSPNYTILAGSYSFQFCDAVFEIKRKIMKKKVAQGPYFSYDFDKSKTPYTLVKT